LVHNFAEKHTLADKIPAWKIKKLTGDDPVIVSGPYNKQTPPSTFCQAFGVTISTYPMYSGRSSREGDPICDSYRLQTHRNGGIFCVADGCGWGERPKEASNRVKDTFVLYFNDKVKNMKNCRELAQHLVNSVAYSHFSIFHDKKDVRSAGTTTALGGLLVEVADPEANTEWVFVGVSIGDCKCFKFDVSTKTCVDVTAGNRMNITDARDPGGRLGAYTREGDPDLRNLDLVFAPCAQGDILIVLSDGVHDNLDPQVLGKCPKDLGLEEQKWDDVDLEEGTALKAKFMEDLMTKLITEDGLDITPAIIAKKLIRHCRDITAISRQWMEQNPNKVLDPDYIKFPGKLDHATCLAFVVGQHNPETDDLVPQKGLNPQVWPFS